MAALTSRAVRCVAFGRRVETDIALPGAIPDDDPRSAEIVIRRTATRLACDKRGPPLQRDGAALVFAPNGVADYRCDAAAGTIHVAPCPGADDDEIAALLIATALPGLLWLQGAFMLHAAAVVLPGRDRAVAIAASSGTGKSTMLSELLTRGAHVVADDSVCLRSTEVGAVEASGLAGGYFVHDPDPAARHFMTVGPRRAVPRARLGAILILSHDADDGPATLRRLAPLDALAAILSHRHRARIPALFGTTGPHLADAARVAEVPVHAWRRRTGSIPLTLAEWSAIDRLGEGEDND